MAGVDTSGLAPELRGSLGPVSGLPAVVAPPQRISLERIIEVAAFGFDVDTDVLLGPSRARPVVHWRQITLAAARQAGYSYPAIATYVGCDHTTVIHAVRRVASQPAWSEAAARIVAWASTDEPRTNEQRSSRRTQSIPKASGQVDDELAMRRRAAAADAAYSLS